MNVSEVLLWFFGLTAIVGAFTVVMNPNPFYGALGLLMNFLSLAAIYMLLQTPVLSLLQVIVYAGGIVVFFLVVIMLLDLRGDAGDREISIKGVFALMTVVVFAVISTAGVFLYPFEGFDFFYVSAKAIGRYMLTDGLFAFELSSFLILVGVVVAISVIKLKKEER